MSEIINNFLNDPEDYQNWGNPAYQDEPELTLEVALNEMDSNVSYAAAALIKEAVEDSCEYKREMDKLQGKLQRIEEIVRETNELRTWPLNLDHAETMRLNDLRKELNKEFGI